MAPQEPEQTGHGKREVDDILASVLAAGLPYRVAARAAGCGLSTVKRRMASVRFRAKVQRLRARAVEAAAGRITGVMVDAVDELRKQLRDPDVKVRQTAARSLLTIGTELWKAADLQGTVDDLKDHFARLCKQYPDLLRETQIYGQV